MLNERTRKSNDASWLRDWDLAVMIESNASILISIDEIYWEQFLWDIVGHTIVIEKSQRSMEDATQ